MKKLVVIVLAFISTFSISFSQSREVGVYNLFQIHTHNADFGKLPGVPGCCPNYTSGKGYGYAAGLYYESALTKSLSWQLRLGWSNINGLMTREEVIGNTYDENLNTIEAFSEHRLNTSMNIIELTPTIVTRPYDFPATLNYGFQLGYVLTSTYDQSEEIIRPSDARFLDGSTTRNEFDGDIENASSFFLAGYLSLIYSTKISEKVTMRPEVGLSYNFNNLAEDITWKAHSIRAGVSFGMDLTPITTEPDEATPPPPPLPPPLPPTPPAASVFAIDLDAKGVNEDKREEDIVVFKVEEFLSRQLYPLLPYVFFDENSATIPPKYVRLSPEDFRNFDPNEKFKASYVMQVYYNLLNIVAYRLNENPESTITLVGCNADRGSEKDNLHLSRTRAEAVKRYLVERGGIRASRIEVENRNLPEDFTEPRSEAHIAENRRVEIYSSNPKIIEPLFIYDTLRVTTPPELKIKPKIRSEQGIYSWNITGNQIYSGNNNILFETSGFSELDSVYVWDFGKDPTSVPRTENPLRIKLEATDVLDSTAFAETEIPVEQITIQKKLRRKIDGKYIDDYRLIMFDFDKTNILEQHEQILNLLCEHVEPNSTIRVVGYTDELGAADYNRTLSQNRADKVAAGIPCDYGSISSVGAGETDMQDNDTPEGRIYNRTIIVRVETPIDR